MESLASDSTIVFGQVAYLAVTTGMTVWVARTLYNNGRAFLKDAFQGNEEIAGSINKLLVVGFYLLNIGFVCVQVSDGSGLTSLPTVIRGYSINIGWVMMVLGVMHMINLYIFNRFRKAAHQRNHVMHGSPYRLAPVAPNFNVSAEHEAVNFPAKVPVQP
jgi:hypothetical protein